MERGGCEDSGREKSGRRPPSAGKGHDRDQVSFVAERAEKEGCGNLGS